MPGSRTLPAPRPRLRALVVAASLLLACHQGPWERECPDGDGCEESEVCQKILGFPSYMATHSICAPRCDEDTPCPAPEFGDAEPRCAANKVCELRCGAGTTCPADTVCHDGLCMFPR